MEWMHTPSPKPWNTGITASILSPGLNMGLKKAAELAHLQEYHTQSYPEKSSWIDQLLSVEEKPNTYIDSRLRQMLGDLYEPVMQLKLDQHRNRLQARLPYDVSVK